MSAYIFDTLEKIAAQSGKKDKEAALKEALADELFKKVVVAALDPSVTYGIAESTMPVPRAHEGGSFRPNTFELLRLLASRALSGHAAVNAVQIEMERLSEKSAVVLQRILLKDLRAGFAESTVNKACAGLIPEYPYMRCSLLKGIKSIKSFIGDMALSQEKADGMFANVILRNCGVVVEMMTRQGTVIPNAEFGNVIEQLRKLKPGTANHGEFLVVEDGEVLPREIGNGILNRVIKGGKFAEGQRPLFKVWDQVPVEHFVPGGEYNVPYKRRFGELLKQIKDGNVDGDHLKAIDTRIVRSKEEAFAHYNEMLAKGKEGTVLKMASAIWKDGTSKEQIKLKLEVDIDLEIIAINPGRKGTKNEGRPGAFATRSSCGELVTDVTIKNEALRDRVEKNPDEFINKIIVVRGNQIMMPSASNDKYSLFLPRMAEADYRLDKSAADSLERIKEIFASATSM